ncbi:hypothetical protein PGR6_06590 [Pseudomonas sp. GR 6-02]|nr:hypothetical protein PGR6_06590 [Pseudomonas sp. GR 6-02]
MFQARFYAGAKRSQPRFARQLLQGNAKSCRSCRRLRSWRSH